MFEIIVIVVLLIIITILVGIVFAIVGDIVLMATFIEESGYKETLLEIVRNTEHSRINKYFQASKRSTDDE